MFIRMILLIALIINVPEVSAQNRSIPSVRKPTCSTYSQCYELAQKGNMKAQSNLGTFYYAGAGVTKNSKKHLSGLKKQRIKGSLLLNIMLV